MQDILDRLLEPLLQHVSRVEVIDDTGRAYTHHAVKRVQLSLQDEERTLKIFLDK